MCTSAFRRTAASAVTVPLKCLSSQENEVCVIPEQAFPQKQAFFTPLGYGEPDVLTVCAQAAGAHTPLAFTFIPQALSAAFPHLNQLPGHGRSSAHLKGFLLRFFTSHILSWLLHPDLFLVE